MNEKLNSIKHKINLLKKLDRNYTLFGAQKHQYKINQPISKEYIERFEATHNIKLPQDYIDFLTIIGNGGAGPYYGLEPIQNSLYNDLDFKRRPLLDPGKPFLFTEPWNLEFQPTVDEDENEEQYEIERLEFDERYYDIEIRNGVLAISNFGCAISLNLVVNGADYGYVWTDDRANDQGIYPSKEFGNKNKLTFLDWYELWLDNSLKEIQGDSYRADFQFNQKPWWRFW